MITLLRRFFDQRVVFIKKLRLEHVPYFKVCPPWNRFIPFPPAHILTPPQSQSAGELRLTTENVDGHPFSDNRFVHITSMHM